MLPPAGTAVGRREQTVERPAKRFCGRSNRDTAAVERDQHTEHKLTADQAERRTICEMKHLVPSPLSDIAARQRAHSGTKIEMERSRLSSLGRQEITNNTTTTAVGRPSRPSSAVRWRCLPRASAASNRLQDRRTGVSSAARNCHGSVTIYVRAECRRRGVGKSTEPAAMSTLELGVESRFGVAAHPSCFGRLCRWTLIEGE